MEVRVVWAGARIDSRRVVVLDWVCRTYEDEGRVACGFEEGIELFLNP